MATKFYVKNENTLGYVFDEQPEYFCILAGKPQLGGDDCMDGYVVIGSGDTLRKATVEDFDYYRVCSKGYEL
ncbi:hypothetical protein JC221_102 [Yersinia phage JC221]|nr:hypothetical protein JC221_102 [Yersinia phage JC221]